MVDVVIDSVTAFLGVAFGGQGAELHVSHGYFRMFFEMFLICTCIFDFVLSPGSV